MRTLVKMNFDPEIAKHVGVNAAIIFENVCYWIEKNRLNEKHFYDGDWWTYNSRPAFAKMFTWMTERQIRHSLDKLRDEGYLKVGKYNKHAYDQTLWYALGENDVCQKCKLYRTEMSHGSDENGRPIPNDKPNDKQGELTHSLSTEYQWTKFTLKEQIQLLRSVMTIKHFSDADASALVTRLKKAGGNLETAYNWLYTDAVDGKLSASYFDFTSSGGGVINNLPKSFKDAVILMNERLEKLEEQKPGFIASRTMEVPDVNF